MRWVLHLPYPRPPKGLSANDRAHWATKARATAEVRNLVVALARQARIPQLQRVQVEVVWVVSDKRRRDADGPDPLCKAIYDGLGADRGVSARIVPDDTPEWMQKPRLRIEYRPDDEPHFEVIVTDTSFRPDDIQQLTEERIYNT